MTDKKPKKVKIPKIPASPKTWGERMAAYGIRISSGKSGTSKQEKRLRKKHNKHGK